MDESERCISIHPRSLHFYPLSREFQWSLCSLMNIPVIFRRNETTSKPLVNPTKVYRITGDGNCLFRALSYFLTGRQTYHMILRQKIVDHMNSIEHVLRPHMNSSVKDYLATSNMRNSGVWGTDIEIFAAASLFSVDIYVYSQFGNSFKWSKFSRSMLDRLPVYSQMGIYLQNSTGVHYDVVLDVSGGITDLNTSQNQKINLSSDRAVGQDMITLSTRLFAKGLEPFDVGGDGNCFFRAVSHQLFQNSNFHQFVCSVAIDYIRNHPEQFVESIANNSFSAYINSMSMDGTWADAIVVQAVSDALSCVIDITESALNFNATTIIHPVIQGENHTKIHIGHIDEFHYVSTTMCSAKKPKSNQDTTSTSKVRIEKAQNLESLKKQNSSMSTETECMKRKRSSFNHGEAQHKKPKYDAQKIKYSDVCERQKCIQTFHDLVKSGPEYICTCCDQLWYRTSVQMCKPSSYNMCPGNILELCCTNVKSVDNIEWICYTCHSNLKDGKLPACSKANGMKFPQKSDILNLTSLEERLISPRIPFMQIHELPRGGQFKIHGNVVNVPADVNSTVNVLPRSMNELQTIPVKLKRRLCYKHHYTFQSIRPLKVLMAAQYLAKNSKLFINEGIQVNDAFIETYTNKMGNNLLYGPKCINEQSDQSSTDQDLVFSSPVIESKKDMLNNTNKQHEVEKNKLNNTNRQHELENR